MSWVGMTPANTGSINTTAARESAKGNIIMFFIGLRCEAASLEKGFPESIIISINFRTIVLRELTPKTDAAQGAFIMRYIWPDVVCHMTSHLWRFTVLTALLS